MAQVSHGLSAILVWSLLVTVALGYETSYASASTMVGGVGYRGQTRAKIGSKNTVVHSVMSESESRQAQSQHHDAVPRDEVRVNSVDHVNPSFDGGMPVGLIPPPVPTTAGPLIWQGPDPQQLASQPIATNLAPGETMEGRRKLESPLTPTLHPNQFQQPVSQPLQPLLQEQRVLPTSQQQLSQQGGLNSQGATPLASLAPNFIHEEQATRARQSTHLFNGRLRPSSPDQTPQLYNFPPGTALLDVAQTVIPKTTTDLSALQLNKLPEMASSQDGMDTDIDDQAGWALLAAIQRLAKGAYNYLKERKNRASVDPPDDPTPSPSSPGRQPSSQPSPQPKAPSQEPVAPTEPDREPPSIAGASEPREMAGITEAHNKYRREKGIPDIQWDDDVAALAKSYAQEMERNGCPLRHNQDRKISNLGRLPAGENIAVGSSGYYKIASEVVKAWWSEVKDYDTRRFKCNPGAVCGHYTQVMWKSSTKLGCAKATCTGRPDKQWDEFYVCNYYPPGNFMGEAPW